jgi:hypothetical protein
VRPERLGKLKTFTHLIESRTRELPAFSIVPEPLRYRLPPKYMHCVGIIGLCNVTTGSTYNYHSLCPVLKSYASNEAEFLDVMSILINNDP